VALALLQAAALPIAAPSANRSTAISPTTADHVEKSLGDRVDLILDGGATGFGIESTIVDVTRSPALLLRHGAISLATIDRLAPTVDRGSLVVPDGERAPAPGAYARHYAPRARVVLVAPERVRGEVASLRAGGMMTGVLEQAPGTVAEGPCVVLPADPRGYAARIYAALHQLEDAGCDAIVVARAPQGDAWAAVRDRLERASARER
jgi:L-threonylcarbamoyladenylate synthase